MLRKKEAALERCVLEKKLIEAAAVPLLKKLVLQDLRDISAAEEDVIWM